MVLTVLLGGCSPQSAPGPAEDTLTSGRMKIVCAPEARVLIAREQSAFQALYPQATIERMEGSSRDAVRALYAGKCDLAVLTRDLTPVEREAAVRGRLELEGYRFARDAVIAVVHPGNRVENVTVEDLRRIYEGAVTRWSELGGADTGIAPVIQPPGSDITEYFEEKVMGGEAIRARSMRAASDSDVVARVAADPSAVGYVSLAWSDRGARSLRLAALRGLAYRKPDLETVYRGDYPLGRVFNLYVRARGPKLPNGFITFVTSFDGQRLVRDLGLVPTAVPVRFVRRSPMLGTH
jgi:phosphate transport system substrate-binding protein